MHEIIVNLHMHTRYSDGTGSHADIADAAIKTGLDAVIVTDHNVYVQGQEGFFGEGDHRVLLLVGEEIHDRTRIPQKNHLLVFGPGIELSHRAGDLQGLIKAIDAKGGLSFAAHPTDPPAPIFGEEALTWDDWSLYGLTGVEIWNAFSEFKRHLKSKLHAIYYALNPEKIAIGPFEDTLRKWDEMLSSGRRLVGIGGSDAHALHVAMGPIKRTVFPYEFHFRGINTHLLLDNPLVGELDCDRESIFRAIKQGKAFIGYDLPASTKGFSFSAHGFGQNATMGDEVSTHQGVTLQIRLPQAAECRLIHDGQLVNIWKDQKLCTQIVKEAGAYRVEVYLSLKGRKTGWIFSNPIYLKN